MFPVLERPLFVAACWLVVLLLVLLWPALWAIALPFRALGVRAYELPVAPFVSRMVGWHAKVRPGR